MEAIQELLDLLINNLVDEPSLVKLHYLDPSDNILYINIVVDEKDKCKVIGKKGNTIQAIRTLVHCFGSKVSLKTYVNLVE